MSSAANTLALLGHFTTDSPEIGLTQLCRIAGRDKATTYRYLKTLEAVGFVEQNPATKTYRLGPAVLQLAQVRESTVPRKSGAEPALAALAHATGETCHVSVLSGTTLFALAVCEAPRHSIRAIIDIQTFPLHATASGLCALAFGPATLRDAACADLHPFTTQTVKTPAELDAIIQTARDTGFARSDGSFEAEIHSMSAPIFDQTGDFAGAVAVASVASRVTPSLEHAICQHLTIASRDITRNWGGTIPQQVGTAWARTLTPTLEAAP